MSYKDWLDPDHQVSVEEQIASLIFLYDSQEPDGFTPALWPSEEECIDMGKRILALVLKEFRPDLIADNDWVFNENNRA